MIRERALAWSVARATVAEIDELNILQASLLAMHRAVRALQPQPAYVLVDGNRLPRWEYASEPVVKGDDRVPAIAAASILAKVQRDAGTGRPRAAVSRLRLCARTRATPPRPTCVPCKRWE